MVYAVCASSRLGSDFGLKDQLQRAAVSIMANIAEGFGRGRNNEFAHFLKIARGSCSEVESHLYVAIDAGLIESHDFEKLRSQAQLTGRKISAFGAYLKRHSAEERRGSGEPGN